MKRIIAIILAAVLILALLPLGLLVKAETVTKKPFYTLNGSELWEAEEYVYTRAKFTSPEIVNLIKHFLSLQDHTNGGFKCNDTSEVYTWSDSNSLMFLRLVVDALEDMNGIDYTDIIVDYFMK